MMKFLAPLLLASPVFAETVVASRTIPAQTLISSDDLLIKEITVAGGETDPLLFVGMEARVALYAGRPIRAGDVGLPAIVDRNQIISLIYEQSGLRIATEGRSLTRAGPGEIIRVMNLTSRSIVTAQVGLDGAAIVSD